MFIAAGLPAILYPSERIFLPLLVPQRYPLVWADRVGHLANSFAGIVVATRAFQTHDPLIVPIPAVHGLILAWEPLVAGRCFDQVD